MDLPTAAPASIVEALDDVVFATDAEGRLTYLNPAWTALTGHLVEDPLGTPLAGYLEHLPGSGETRCVTAYGGVRWVQVRARARREGGGCGTIADVTERRRDNARLAEAEARFRGAFDHAATGMAILAPDGRPLRVNGAFSRLAGRTDDALLEATVAEISHPDDVPALTLGWDRLASGELGDHSMELRLVRPDGAVVWVRHSCALVRDESGSPLYAVVQLQDVTAQLVADAGSRARGPEETRLRRDLRAALEHEEIRLAFQPVVALASGRIVGLEALLRWEDPRAGLRLPGEFLPAATSAGLIEAFGQWALRSACAALADWRSRGLAHDITVSVNLSAAELRRGDLPDVVAAALREADLPPEALRLEVGDDAIGPAVQPTLRALARLGVALTVDDFGAGTAAFQHVVRMPALAKIKVDRALVRGAAVSREDAAVLAAIISLGRSLAVDVVAAGIESAAEVRLLRGLGCSLGQGFWFGRPQPGAEVEQLLRRAALGELGI